MPRQMGARNAEVVGPPIGLRAGNKDAKLQRIVKAARELFEVKGYDRTTIRDVALSANVGNGTVSFYASTKRELLFLVINSAYGSWIEHAFSDHRQPVFVIDEFLIIFAKAYGFLLDQDVLSHLMVQELSVLPNKEMLQQEALFDRNRVGFMARLAGIVEDRKITGQLRSDLDSERAARVVFAAFQYEAKDWLSKPAPSVETGVAELRKSLEVMFHGFTIPD